MYTYHAIKEREILFDYSVCKIRKAALYSMINASVIERET